MAQQFLEIPARIQSREPVFAHPGRQAAGGGARAGGALALADVAVEPHEMRHRAGNVADGFDVYLVPELRPVLAIVAQQRARAGALAQRRAQPHSSFLFAIAPLERAQIGTQQFRGSVTGEPLEGGIDKDHRMIDRPGGADHDAFGRGIDHAAEKLRGPLVLRIQLNFSAGGCTHCSRDSRQTRQ